MPLPFHRLLPLAKFSVVPVSKALLIDVALTASAVSFAVLHAGKDILLVVEMASAAVGHGSLASPPCAHSIATVSAL
jgi:hypothetical protein